MHFLSNVIVMRKNLSALPKVVCRRTILQYLDYFFGMDNLNWCLATKIENGTFKW